MKLSHLRSKTVAVITATSTSMTFAQVATVATSVSSKIAGLLTVVQALGGGLFTLALVFAGYKFAFVENTKIADLKGILIGGTIFGAAAGIATYLQS